MLKKILLGLGALVALLLVVIATRPATYRVERSLAIQAPADVIFPYINDLKLWSTWSPWEKLDPSMAKSFEGPAAGVGSSYGWKGNDKVGEGQLTITESRENDAVAYKLEFIEPFASTATNGITLKPEGDGVVAVWWMAGDNNFVGKAFSLVMDMDQMIGKDFEAGLASLKVLSETAAQEKKAALEAAKKAEEAAAAQTAQATDPNAAPADANAALTTP